MAVLLNAVTTNTVGTGAATATADSLIEIPNTSVFGYGCSVEIETSSVNTANLFAPIGRVAVAYAPLSFSIRLPVGHFVRAVLRGATATTNVTVNLLDIE
jgi:hypothetical protein